MAVVIVLTFKKCRDGKEVFTFLSSFPIAIFLSVRTTEECTVMNGCTGETVSRHRDVYFLHFQKICRASCFVFKGTRRASQRKL